MCNKNEKKNAFSRSVASVESYKYWGKKEARKIRNKMVVSKDNKRRRKETETPPTSSSAAALAAAANAAVAVESSPEMPKR